MGKAVPFDEVLARHLQDPEFRAEWERTAVPRAVALWLVRYRAEHGLSQRALAARVGLQQPTIARLEAGDTEPKLSTLLRLSMALGTPVELLVGGDGVAPPVPVSIGLAA
ncbi:MAG: helix-turn-helix transcriptional regulator [Armatimonadetes bacterium]|nr:helix-turn-helix transcriptional regulator [Armatimonadota bacterium]